MAKGSQINQEALKHNQVSLIIKSIAKDCRLSDAEQ
jgi:hypothetical protein